MNRFSYRMGMLFLSIFLLLSTIQAQKAIRPSTALERYINNGDKNFSWEIKESYEVGDVTVYALLLTSQKWREYTWTHQLSILVPKEIKYDGALQFITGGSINKEGLPNWSGKGDGLTESFCAVAKQNSAIVAILKQAPNQPLYDNLTEDALISFTLHNFKKDGDYSWPLLFPMVKGAKRAMDAVQEFAKQKLNHTINRFVVSGASKRGWTTWLIGANDKRVTAIAPMVIDMLNMPVSMNYQVKVWNDYSIQIEDYVKLGIVQDLGAGNAADITTMIDPYSYRKKLTIPKMILMGTNDEYWPIDNIKNYIDSIPGQNLIHYIPNVGHGMGDKKEALSTVSSFFGLTLKKLPYPVCTWKTAESTKGVTVSIKTTSDKLTDVIIWTANSTDLDFRNDKWEPKSLGIKNTANVIALEEFPTSGYRAFYVNVKYKDANGSEYTESTRVFMTDTKKVL
ncbi:MAG: PhoPQ-activated pathogenicity-related family protein [Chitinophagaceae bacterium]|nr:PhoPQ-activated pathogenicity-related family protein [Chitinophagaceae bacterium]MDP1763345.1 PhoPQ-activated protein PqaA family protein [Sediminibacterium sp.]MDP1812133.1 PhoPQ-activated protein PqaA family protein [Sediminibacterium sp.]MDP3127051.1 PhoPQ-activated protein PqaA family protein [Sediminibacterium sp.]